ncbi:hypothetical protein M2352_003469 [Azospirillum fermentarium]|uniref:hypothetical protein n=1 Tax=Azospirillum fermentarium TaxID=1233114 RepID=UPI002225F2C6|nr:hypothetical protein [Azospirillum fermentarium]MCW2247835.1 hypothetical protein [Azospirillum fermentarium]
MKKFKDLEVFGPDDKLIALIDVISKNLPAGWRRDLDAEKRLAGFGEDATGFAFALDQDGLPPSGVFVLKESGKLSIPNIVPRQSGELSFDQYNNILDQFSDILRPFISVDSAFSLNVTSGRAVITDWVSPEAAELLRKFSALANMSTGSSHPLDFKRWAAFIAQAHREGSSLDADSLARWLVEELEWPADRAAKLGSEYQFARDILNEYDQT